MIRIYDLDGTVIDSSHRQAAKPNGDFDLDHWRENCTPEKIMADTVKPLAHVMRKHYFSGEYVIICTSRIMQQADFDFLDKHGLHCDAILFRPEGCDDADADLKEFMLDEFFDGMDTCIEAERIVMYEDNFSVIDRLSSRGIYISVQC